MARFYAFTFPPIADPRSRSTPIKNVVQRLLDRIVAARLRQAEKELQRWSTAESPLSPAHRAQLSSRLAALHARWRTPEVL